MRIIDPRSLDIVRECGRSGSDFGICLFLDGDDNSSPPTPAAIGTPRVIRNPWNGPRKSSATNTTCSSVLVAAATLAAGQSAEYPLGRVRKGYLVAARGRIEVNGVLAAERDGVAIAEEEVVRVTALEDSEVVLVDVA